VSLEVYTPRPSGAISCDLNRQCRKRTCPKCFWRLRRYLIDTLMHEVIEPAYLERVHAKKSGERILPRWITWGLVEYDLAPHETVRGWLRTSRVARKLCECSGARDGLVCVTLHPGRRVVIGLLTLSGRKRLGQPRGLRVEWHRVKSQYNQPRLGVTSLRVAMDAVRPTPGYWADPDKFDPVDLRGWRSIQPLGGWGEFLSSKMSAPPRYLTPTRIDKHRHQEYVERIAHFRIRSVQKKLVDIVAKKLAVPPADVRTCRARWYESAEPNPSYGVKEPYPVGAFVSGALSLPIRLAADLNDLRSLVVDLPDPVKFREYQPYRVPLPPLFWPNYNEENKRTARLARGPFSLILRNGRDFAAMISDEDYPAFFPDGGPLVIPVTFGPNSDYVFVPFESILDRLSALRATSPPTIDPDARVDPGPDAAKTLRIQQVAALASMEEAAAARRAAEAERQAAEDELAILSTLFRAAGVPEEKIGAAVAMAPSLRLVPAVADPECASIPRAAPHRRARASR